MAVDESVELVLILTGGGGFEGGHGLPEAVRQVVRGGQEMGDFGEIETVHVLQGRDREISGLEIVGKIIEEFGDAGEADLLEDGGLDEHG